MFQPHITDEEVPQMSQGRQQVHELHACAGPGFLGEVHCLLERVWATSPDVSGIDRMMLETAVIEIAANIIEHGSAGAGPQCDLTIEVYPDRLDAHFMDDGIIALVNVDTAAMPDALAEGGRGLAIARAALDVLTYERRNNTNFWTLNRVRNTG